MMRLATLVLLLAVSITAAPLDVFHPIFTDPFSSSPTDVMLQIDVEIACPENLVVTVVVPGTGTQPDSPQFEPGAWGPVAFNGDPLKCNGFNCGATIQFQRIANVPVSTLTFSKILYITPATDSQSIPIPGRWRLFVAIPINPNFLAAGATPLVITATDNLAPSITRDEPEDFSVSLDGRQCGGAGVNLDPIFSGFQGQVYQFHGLPDEHFNLVSTPSIQVNSHFVYLSNGHCDYNDTGCWTHPGTYVDQLGFTIGDTRLKIQAGPHDIGMRVWLMDHEIRPSERRIIFAINNSSIDTATVRFIHHGKLEILTPLLNFQLDNSDHFINVAASLNDVSLLRLGSKRRDITDHNVCKTQSTHDHQMIENKVAKLYPTQTQLHGLVGQTWRNVKICSRDWMGQVEDYLVADGLFGTSYNYNYFKQN